MTNLNFTESTNLVKRGFYLSFLLLVVLTSLQLGQTDTSSENKSDQSLKGSVRVNPSTLAMEFSLPLGVYHGRSGNSLPVTMTYSSKVWGAKIASSIYTDSSDTNPQNPPDPRVINDYKTALFAYGQKKSAGWSNSLQPPRIVQANRFFLERPTTGLSGNGGPEFNFAEEVEIPEDVVEEVKNDLQNNLTDCESFNSRSGYTCTVCTLLNDGPFIFDVSCEYTGGGGAGGGGPIGWPTGGGNTSNNAVASLVKRARIQMPDGSIVEFRKDDIRFQCGFLLSGNQNCMQNLSGTYLAVDGSRMRLEFRELQPDGQTRHVLYLPDGSRYLFPTSSAPSSPTSTAGFTEAEEYVDSNGNKMTFDRSTRIWTDTVGRSIQNPFPSGLPNDSNPINEGTRTVNLPSLPGITRQAQFVWKKLKTGGCETDTTGSCGESVLENAAQELRFVGPDTGTGDNVNLPSLFQGRQWSVQSSGLIQNYKENVTGGDYVNGVAQRFNPVVLKEAILPDGTKYEFRYNIYGEISRIKYPSGAVERFAYDAIPPMGYDMIDTFDKSNRGVIERKVYPDEQSAVNDQPEQSWQYHAELSPVPNSAAAYKVTITAPDQSYSERLIHRSHDFSYGFSNSVDGLTYDEKVFAAPDANGVKRLVSRKLTDWKQDGPLPGGYFEATRDPRPERTIVVTLENGKALATMSETEYEAPGENGSTAPDDRSYFARLNAKQTKSYHFLELSSSDAQNLDIGAIKSRFYQFGQIASISQTDYQYDSSYRTRGIIGLPTETRALNPSNPSDILAKTQFVYDEAPYFDNNYTTTNWADPGSILRGNATTTRTWNKDTNTWLESHTMFDNFGNVRKVWEVNEDYTSSRFVETQYDSANKYAYPTKINTPAPDPADTTGTSQTSTTETTYDFTTGLPLTVKDDFGQITETQYDSMLRPWRVFGQNFTAPEAQTIYGQPDTNGQFPATERFVKVRKQIDANNWDEATTWADALGRTIKTQAKDSQGDVFVETHYDSVGRVDRVTNPYRAGDTVYWSKTRYDEAGRAVETYAPAEFVNLGSAQSLGVTSFDISTVPNFIGTVVTTVDASLRRSRSITNALGQLIRVDEPIAIGGTADADLGSLASPNQPTVYNYDLNGKLVEVTQGVQHRYFKYDSLGRLIRVKQPEQEPNPGLAMSDPYNTDWQWTAGFTYDVLGNVVTVTDANGTVIHNEYDRANRVTRRYYTGEPAGQTTPEVNFYYDGKGLASPQSPNFAKGKLTKVTSSVSTSLYSQFDNFGRLKESSQITDGNTYTSKYTYNLSGALIEEEYPSGRKVKNEFETDGDLARIYGTVNATAPERTYANSFTYTPDGKIESLHLGNLLWEKARFNNRLQVTELALGHGVNQGDLWKLGYEYGELNIDGTVNIAKNTGNIAKQTLSFNGLAQPFVQTYKYDSLYRLKEARETAGTGGSAPQTWKETFDYDRYGNRTAHDKFFDTTLTATSNITDPTIDPSTNRFNAGQGYGFDKNGNLISDAQNRGFNFNADNKQSKVFQNGNLRAEYFFDGEGKRVKKKVYDPGNSNIVTEETVFVYSAGKLIAEYSTAPPPEHPTTSYTATDQLGSPRVITDSVGTVVSRRDFMPFGEESPNDAAYRTLSLYPVGDNVRQKFTGYQKDDETQLDFAEARMYENRHARFTAVDPLLASGKNANPQTFNRYVYVLNNPLILTDPHGLQAGWSKYESKVKIDGQEVPWVSFHYFTGNEQKNTYNAINGTNFQKFEGMYYLYGPLSGDHVFATLSSSGTYYEQEYKGSELIWNWALNAQNNGDSKAVDNLMFSGVLSGVTESVFSKNDNVAVRDIDVRLGIIPVFTSPNAGIVNSGGRFATLDAARAEGEVAHHIPQNAFMRNLGSSRSDGPALGMTIEDHELTRTFAGRGASTMRSDIGLNARERMFKDIISIRRTFGSRYNEGIREMLRYSRTLPEFQQKSPFRFFSRPRFTSGQGN
jgi:RHS repeat-associated protein